MHATLHSWSFLTCCALGLPLAAQERFEPPADLAQFLAMLQDGPAPRRDAAVAAAAGFGAAAIPALRTLLLRPGGQEQDATFRATAALRALWRIANAASAPGHAARAATAKALLDLLAGTPALPPVPAGEVVRMAGIVADDEANIRRLGDLLEQEELREPALFALQQIPNLAADTVLLARLDRPGAASRARIAQALGVRRTAAATAPLLALLPAATPAEAPVLRHALAVIGDAASTTVLHDALAQDAPGAAADWLVFLAARTAARATAAELQPHWRALLGHARADLRAAAVPAVASSQGDLPAVVAALGDQDVAVRGAARSALAVWPAIDAALLQAHGSAAPAVRGGLLLVLATRKNARALELARADCRHAEAAVRCAAVEVLALAGAPGDEDALFAAAIDADPAVRATAARGLAASAARRQQQHDQDGALRLLHRILAAGGDAELLRDAIARTGRIAAPASLPALEPLLADARFREPALDARLQIAAALPADDKARAVEILQATFAASHDRGRRKKALEHLRRLGVDTAPLVEAGGFVQDWFVLGPWPKAKDKDSLAQQPFGAAPDPNVPVVSEGVELRWQHRHTDDPDGLVDLGFLKPRDNVSAFAMWRFRTTEDLDVTLALGSDDAVAVWLDGALVHANWTARGVHVDEDKVKLHLTADVHTLLLRIDQGGGDFGFCLRILDHGGTPRRFQTVPFRASRTGQTPR